MSSKQTPSTRDVMDAFWARARRDSFASALKVLRRFAPMRPSPISHDVPAADRQDCIDALRAGEEVAA